MQVTLKYGCESLTITVPVGTTVGQLRSNPNYKAALGYGDRTNWLIDGVVQPNNVVLGADQVVRIETSANTKAA